MLELVDVLYTTIPTTYFTSSNHLAAFAQSSNCTLWHDIMVLPITTFHHSHDYTEFDSEATIPFNGVHCDAFSFLARP